MRVLLLPRWVRWWGVGCWLILSPAVFGVDGKVFIVQKGIQYVQGSAAAPLEDLKNGVIFDVTAQATITNVVQSVLLKPSAGSLETLSVNGPDAFELKRKFDTQGELETAFPNGTYTLTVSTVHDGQLVLALPLTGDLYPNVPRVSNYQAAQTIDAGAYFLITWEAFVGGTGNDFVQVHIDDSNGQKVFETPDAGDAETLNGLATSLLIPPRTLPAGQMFQAVLIFGKTVTRDIASYPGALGLCQYYKRTKFSLQTTAVPSQAAVKLFQVQKSRRFSQTSAGAPVLQTSKTFNFDLSVDASASGSPSDVTVLMPSGTPQKLLASTDGKSFSFAADALVQSGFDATYPNGQYNFDFGTAAGPRTVPLELNGDLYPDPPHLNHWPAGRVDPNLDLAWSWDPFTEGSSTDFSQLHVEDDLANKVFETPDFGKSGALDGTALEATIPHGNLLPGKTYTARLIFQKNLALQTSAYPGALGVPSYASRTTFKFSTETTPVFQAPALSALPFSLVDGVQLVVQGLPGGMIRLDGSADLRQWTPVSTNTLPVSGQMTLRPVRVGNFSYGYYRAGSLP